MRPSIGEPPAAINRTCGVCRGIALVHPWIYAAEIQRRDRNPRFIGPHPGSRSGMGPTKTVLEAVQLLHSGDAPSGEEAGLRDLRSALMAVGSDELRFGTPERGPCSVSFADTLEGKAVSDLFAAKPDLACQSTGIVCRGLVGDPSIVAIDFDAQSERRGEFLNAGTLALCVLGTDEAIDRLRSILIHDVDARVRRLAAMGLVWHHDHSGRECLIPVAGGEPFIDRITPRFFLAAGRHQESARWLLDLFDGNPAEETRARLLRCLLVKRRREPLDSGELRSWLLQRAESEHRGEAS